MVLLPDLGALVVEVADASHAPVAAGRLRKAHGNTNHVRGRVGV